MADKKRRWGKKEKTDVPMGTTTFATPQRAGRNIASEYAGVLRNHKSQLDMISQSGMQREMTLAKVLDDNAFYIQESVCRQDDLSFYSALLEELEFKDAWMKGGGQRRMGEITDVSENRGMDGEEVRLDTSDKVACEFLQRRR
eukprot:GEMP01073664.1.p1 GENE.GEMP01073664.1~~GEMP01073664.1.p1  ORF type:complete len:143 (+),score=29.12 GEMP01073664.1:35-463(+)